MTKSILITGHTGNLGSICVEYFKSKEWNVTGISRSNGYDLTDYTYNHPLFDNDNHYDLVFMCHGIVESALIRQINYVIWDQIIETNLKSIVELTGELIKRDRLNDNALIVYCSSIQATHPREGRFLYGLSKLGLELLAKSVHIEHSPKIRSIALRLGQMEKLMANRTFTDEERLAIEQFTPLPWVNCLDVAKLVECLYEQRSLSGTTINVDSGHSLSVWPK